MTEDPRHGRNGIDPAPLRKRFYEKAAVEEADGLFAVVLDGRPIRTPGGGRLALPTADAAAAVAREWDAQKVHIDPAEMPLTRIANTALDRLAASPELARNEILNFARSDMLCYRANAPAQLVERQASAWQPLLDWAAQDLGVELQVTSGIVHVEQPAGSIDAAADYLAGLDCFVLAALHTAVTVSGSAVVGLALISGRIGLEDACTAAFLDETYQADVWGADEEAELRRQRLRSELAASAGFRQALG